MRSCTDLGLLMIDPPCRTTYIHLPSSCSLQMHAACCIRPAGSKMAVVIVDPQQAEGPRVVLHDPECVTHTLRISQRGNRTCRGARLLVSSLHFFLLTGRQPCLLTGVPWRCIIRLCLPKRTDHADVCDAGWLAHLCGRVGRSIHVCHHCAGCLPKSLW